MDQMAGVGFFLGFFASFVFFCWPFAMMISCVEGVYRVIMSR
jgi:hypothetical protein